MKLKKALKRCGVPVSNYHVSFSKNVETETCETVSELATQNIEWLNAHITSTVCERRLEKVSLNFLELACHEIFSLKD